MVPIDRDRNKLYPVLRKKFTNLEKKLKENNIPIRLCEGFRSMERQAELYAQGRTSPGNVITSPQGEKRTGKLAIIR